MNDLISRQQAIDALRTCYDTETITMDNGDEYINYGDAVGEIEQLPSAQPMRGRWIEYNYPGSECVYCDQCKTEYYPDDLFLGGNDYPNFCPNCGADMRGEQYG